MAYQTRLEYLHIGFSLTRNTHFRSFIQVAVFGIWSAIHLFQVRQSIKENRPEVKENDESSQSQGFYFFSKIMNPIAKLFMHSFQSPGQSAKVLILVSLAANGLLVYTTVACFVAVKLIPISDYVVFSFTTPVVTLVIGASLVCFPE